jgi:hypothetical protein
VRGESACTPASQAVRNQMNMKDKKESTVELKSWLTRSLNLKNTSFEKVVQNFKELLSAHGFKLKKQNETKASAYFEAIYGSRIVAILMHFIPYIGRNLPLGKRLGLKATITNGNPIALSITIVPYMEIFNTSEVFILTQTIDEKASDEYVAARKMFSITKALYDSYDVEPKESLGKFENKVFLRDSVLSLLIYPLDGYKSSKKVHFPDAHGPKWCWPASIIPELWFIWHEIWGVSLLMIAIELITVFKMVQYGLGSKFIGVTLIVFRILPGLAGNRIFYLRYGRWPKEKNRKISNTANPSDTKSRAAD